MIQDIKPKVFHNEYIEKCPEINDFVMFFMGKKILIKETDGRIAFPCKQEMDILFQNAQEEVNYTYLFCIDNINYFLAMYDNGAYKDINIEKDFFRFEKVANIRYGMSQEACFAVYTSYHLYVWYRDNRYCGRCGKLVKQGDKERMLYCEACGNQMWPKIAPAVIVAVTNGDKVVLSKYADREYKRYALLAGFVEIGETAEDTVRREVMEEVGLRVKNIRYYKTQPWGIESNLLIGYFAELDGDDTIHRDAGELAVAEWVPRERLKDMDDGFSLTREMMRVFYEGREPK